MTAILQNEQIPQDVQDEIDAVKAQFSELLVTQEQAVMRLGRALQKPLAETPEKICGHIKYILREAIEQGAITERRIEQLCPDEWKNSTKAEAGRQGAEKSAARHKVKVAAGGGSDTESESVTEGLQAQINEMREQLESMKPTVEALKTISDKARELDGSCTCETCEMAKQVKL